MPKIKRNFWKQRYLFVLIILISLAWILIGGCKGKKPTGPTVETLKIINPGVNLEEYTIWEPEERLNDPRAQDSTYVYLVIGKDAVKISGPLIFSQDGIEIENIFKLEDEGIEIINPQEYYADGFEVIVNSRLSYSISIIDFEYEINLGQVTLIKEEDAIRSECIFAATGDGVAHHLIITAVVNGDNIRSTTPVTIEARGSK